MRPRRSSPTARRAGSCSSSCGGWRRVGRRSSSRARAAPGRSSSPGSSTTGATASVTPSWRSTARPSPRACSRASSSDTRRARSPAPSRPGPAASSGRRAGRSSSTRSARSARISRRSSCGCCRTGSCCPWAARGRVVTATNRSLRDEIAAGRFRDDLFYRLNVNPMQLAPLRERREDILPLARHFLARHAAESGRRLALTPEAEEALAGHGWPGNVRELENAIERAVVLAHGERILPEDLLLEQGGPGGEAPPEGTLQDSLDRAAAARIRSALEAARGNRAEAARTLGIDRTTLYRLMKRLGLPAS